MICKLTQAISEAFFEFHVICQKWSGEVCIVSQMLVFSQNKEEASKGFYSTSIVNNENSDGGNLHQVDIKIFVVKTMKVIIV